MSTVAVVLLNYNNYDPDTRRCLASLHRLGDPLLRPVVIDNASSDGCARLIATEFPEVVVLRQEQNLGFAGGNNQGIRWALAEGCEYVLVLNNDTEISDKTLIPDMISVLEENDRIGILGPRVFDVIQGEEQTTTLTPPSWTLRQRLFDRPAHSEAVIATDTVSVEGISAVCWLIPARVLERTGLMDEDIFIYADDNEFCYRLRRAGYEIGRFDRIGVKHYFTSTKITSLRSLRHRLAYVNYMYALRKHGASLPLVTGYAITTAWRLLRHLIVVSPKRTYRNEVTSYCSIVGNMARQLFRGRSSIKLLPRA